MNNLQQWNIMNFKMLFLNFGLNFRLLCDLVSDVCFLLYINNIMIYNLWKSIEFYKSVIAFSYLLLYLRLHILQFALLVVNTEKVKVIPKSVLLINMGLKSTPIFLNTLFILQTNPTSTQLPRLHTNNLSYPLSHKEYKHNNTNKPNNNLSNKHKQYQL